MRFIALMSVVSLLTLPVAACAQDQTPPQPPTAAGAAGQYQPGTLPPEPPVIEPPLPGQPDNMQPSPPGPDDAQPPMAGQADNMAPPPAPDDAPPPPPGAYGAPPPDGAYPPPRGQHGPDAAKMQKFEARFEAANTTGDGRLTLQQAESANLRAIVKHFNQIDTQHRGYVTLNQVMAWRMDQEAQQMERRAAQLRAEQSQ